MHDAERSIAKASTGEEIRFGIEGQGISFRHAWKEIPSDYLYSYRNHSKFKKAMALSQVHILIILK